MLKAISTLLVIGLPVFTAVAQAQDVQSHHERTATPLAARFEIVQSPKAVRLTFKVDKHRGRTYQLVLAADSTLTWELVPREEHPAGSTELPNQVNYQVFTSGVAVRFTFLLNVNTGATWQLTQGDDESLHWGAMP